VLRIVSLEKLRRVVPKELKARRRSCTVVRFGGPKPRGKELNGAWQGRARAAVSRKIRGWSAYG